MVMAVATEVGRGNAPAWATVSTAVGSARQIVVGRFQEAQAIVGEVLVDRLLDLAAEMLLRPESEADPSGLHLVAEVYRYVS